MKVEKYAKQITELREALRSRAAAVAREPYQLKFFEEKELDELSKRVSRDHYPVQGLKERQKRPELQSDTPPGLRRHIKKSKPLSLDQKLELVHRAIVDGETNKDLAKDFRVSQQVVSLLVSKVRKKPSMLSELINSRADR